MNKFLIILFFSISVFSQNQNKATQSSIKDQTKKELFSDKELSKIDSLLVQEKMNSSLVDTLDSFIDDEGVLDNEPEVLTTELLKERLYLLGQKTPFNLEYNPDLEKVINSYLSTRKKTLGQILGRAKYYFPMFERYLDEYKIPLSMKYLAIVESALLPKISNRSGATGMWQFMYGTGKMYGLKVSSYLDERQDPVKSTIAACKYLSRLYKIFGDWDLALAAYNSGPGNVSKAIKRSGGHKNYWNIRNYLPKETAGYVPAFYATLYILEHADDHNIISEAPEFYRFETDTIRVKRTIGFKHISKALELDEEVISFLNPIYKLDIIPFVEGEVYAVRLPKDKIIEFLDKENDIYALADADDATREKPLPRNQLSKTSTRYKVRSGDFLGKIAEKFGVRVSDIKRWNSLKSNNLKIGQRLTIFSGKTNDTVQNSTNEKETVSSKSGDYEVYEVKNGDSLWIIARKFKNVSVDNIKKWNNIWSAKSLKPGTKLKIFKG